MPPPQGEAFVRALLAQTARHGVTTARQLAHRSGVSYDTVRAWRRGATPQPETLSRLSDLTGLTVAQMLDLWQGEEAEEVSLASALRELATELREWRLQRHDFRDRLDEQEAVLRALSAARTEDVTAPRALPENGG